MDEVKPSGIVSIVWFSDNMDAVKLFSNEGKHVDHLFIVGVLFVEFDAKVIHGKNIF